MDHRGPIPKSCSKGLERRMPKQVRVCLIGAGHWAATNHIPALLRRKDVQLVGICSKDPVGGKKIQQTYGIDLFTDNYEELLAVPDLDCAVISSPHDCHFEHAHAAIDRGLNVLVEKPLAIRADDARRLGEKAKARGVTIVNGYGYNFTNIVQTAHRYTVANAFGEVEHLVAQMASRTGDIFDGKGQHNTAKDLVQPRKATWSDPLRGGGYGWGQLVHLLGIIFYIVPKRAESVFAHVVLSESGADKFDALCFRFEGGATATVSGAATYTFQCGNQVDVRVFGSNGVLLLDLERHRLEFHSRDGWSEHMAKEDIGGEDDFRRPIDALVDLCLGKSVENAAPDYTGIWSVEVLDAMYRSAKSGMVEQV